MKIVNTHEAKTHLSRLLDEAVSGEEIVIARAGKPVARLVALTVEGARRTLGLLAGTVSESEDLWAPDPELEKLFYGDRNRNPGHPPGEPPASSEEL